MTYALITLAPRLGAEKQIALFSLAYAAAGAIFSWDAYIILLKQYSETHFAGLPPMLFVGLLVASIVASPRAPITWLQSLLKQRAAGAAAIIVLFCLSIASFSTFKHHIPAWLPFFADKPLADLDDLLHFGQPWRLTHAAAPELAAPVLAYLYGPVWFAQWLGMVLFAAFLPNDRLRVRYLFAFATIILLLGTVMRAAGASAGPIFYDRMFGGDRFVDLMSALASDTFRAHMISASNYLYSSYIADDAVFGAGISAMPSIHVAMAVLNALFLSSFNRWLGTFGWIFAVSIMFGSVYFGWHYALDGYVSIAAVLLIWRWAARVAVCHHEGTR